MAMNLFGNQHLKQVRQLTRLGDLQTACAIARESGCLRSAGGVRAAHSLVDQLVVRAERQECAGNLVAAWQDLNDAVSVQTDDRIDLLARHQSRLIDSTVQHAESCLQRGQVTNAHRLVDILARRKILDRRADEIISVCSLVSNAQVLAASGKWNESSRMLQQARELRPDMEFVESRLRANQQDEQSVHKMTSQLRDALNQSNWDNVQTIASQILQVSPNHQIAMDARRRCQSHYVRQPAATQQQVIIIDEPGKQRKGDTVHTINDNETTRSSTALAELWQHKLQNPSPRRSSRTNATSVRLCSGSTASADTWFAPGRKSPSAGRWSVRRLIFLYKRTFDADTCISNAQPTDTLPNHWKQKTRMIRR